MNKKLRYVIAILIAVLSILFVFLLVMSAGNATSGFNMLRSFTVTINNKSDYDVVSVELGIVKGSSKHTYSESIHSGDSKRLKPDLSLSGEGAVYMKYTDSNGDTVEKLVCGYTESLSGVSKVTIHNDNVTVEEDCY